MNNEGKLNYHNAFEFVKAFEKYTKEIPEIHIVIKDLFGTNFNLGASSQNHGDHTYAVIKQYSDLLEEVLPQIKIIYHLTKSAQEAEKLTDIGQNHLMNVSMVSSSNADVYNRIAKKGTDITASSGNDGGTQMLYPSSQDKCTCVTAFDLYGKLLSFLQYSNRHSMVDIGGLSNQFVSGITVDGYYFEDTFGGTSCASPDITGVKLLIYVWFLIVFGRRPSYQDLNKYLLNFCTDYGQDGRDDKSGYGVPVLWDNNLNWFDPYKEWLTKRERFNKDGELVKHKMFNLNLGYTDLITRGNIWIMFASLMGWQCSSQSDSQQKKAFDYIQETMKLYANNSENYIYKKDLIVVIARYLATNSGLLDTDKDGIVDIFDVDYKEIGQEAYYELHVKYLEEVWDIYIYDTTQEAMNGFVTYEVAGALIARAFGFDEKFKYIDVNK